MTYDVFGDWGTSRLRLYRMAQGVVTDRIEAPGMAMLDRSPEATIEAALGPWRSAGEPGHVRLCGMVGAKGGWLEVPYVDCPTDRMYWRRHAASLSFQGIPVSIMAGLACVDADGFPDVMRGEETQIFGAIALDPALADGASTLVLPGTHSKWATVVDGRVTGFRTFLTGELFALLHAHSTLLRAAQDGPGEDEDAGFAVGLAQAEHGPGLLASLFAARAMQLRHARSRQWALGFLSGLLIGSEIADMTRALPQERSGFVIIGGAELATRYQAALAMQGISALRLDGGACARAGLATSGEF